MQDRAGPARRVADVVAERIEKLIVDGVLKAGRALLPTLDAPELHHALTRMLVSPERNIGSMDAWLQAGRFIDTKT